MVLVRVQPSGGARCLSCLLPRASSPPTRGLPRLMTAMIALALVRPLPLAPTAAWRAPSGSSIPIVASTSSWDAPPPGWNAPPPSTEALAPLLAAKNLDPGLRRLARAEARRGLQQIYGPFRVRRLPRAGSYLGWTSEFLLGARVAMAQLPLVSGWKGSAACAAAAMLVVLPLVSVSALGRPAHWCLLPFARLFARIFALVDAAVLSLSAAVVSAFALCLSCFGLFDTVAGGADGVAYAASCGPRLIQSAARTISTKPQVGLLFSLVHRSPSRPRPPPPSA